MSVLHSSAPSKAVINERRESSGEGVLVQAQVYALYER